MDDVARQNAQAYDAHADAWSADMQKSAAHRFLEKPAMRARILADLERADILCIGVGAGDELADLVVHNPKRIVGIDISERLLAHAQRKFPSMETYAMDMRELTFPDASFDFVYSSLAFHYAADWDALLAGIYRVLRPGGTLLFSTHNPPSWAGKEATGRAFTNPRGVVVREHRSILHAGVPVTFYNHASTDAIVEAVRFAGFLVDEVALPDVSSPPMPLRTKAEKDDYAGLVKKNTACPLFFVVRAHRP